MLVRCSMARFPHTPTASPPRPSPPDCPSAAIYARACTHTHAHTHTRTHTHTHTLPLSLVSVCCARNEHFAPTANAHLIISGSDLPQAAKADTKVQFFAMATTNPRIPGPARAAVFSVRAASTPQGSKAGAVSAPSTQAMLACCKGIPAS
jgi:hypothetical protein